MLLRLAALVTLLAGLGCCQRPPAEFECPRDEDGLCGNRRYPYPWDCQMYYRCFSPECIAFTFACPEGLHFNDVVQECISPMLANCTESTSAEPIDTTLPATTIDVTTEESSTEAPTTEPTTPEQETTEAPVPTTTPVPTTEVETTEVPTTTTTTQAPTTTELSVTAVPTAAPTPTPSEDGVVFYAVRTSDWSGNNQILILDDTRVNVGGRFEEEYFFVANSSSLHFFSLSAGVPQRSGVSLQIANIDKPTTTILRESNVNQGIDTIYRNTLATLEAEQPVYVEALTDLVGNEQNSLISWSGFSFDLFDKVIAFSVGRNEPYTPNTPQANRIEMQEVLLNEGGHYDFDKFEFVAPEDGIYYFTFTLGQIEGNNARIGLGVARNGGTPDNEAEVVSGRDNTNELNVKSRSTVVELNEGDIVWVSTLNPTTFSDPDNMQTSFSGFKYSPRGKEVVWSVHRLAPLVANPEVPIDPVEFSEVAVNVGEVYDADTDLFTVPVTGYYFLEINIGVLGTSSGRRVDVQLLKGGEPGNEEDRGEVLCEVIHDFIPQANDNVGRSLVVRLEAGDQIRLLVEAGSGVYSDLERQTTFLGFLLLEE